MNPSRWAWVAIALAAMMIGQAEASPASVVHARRLMDSGVAHVGVGANRDAVAELSQALATKALSHTDVVRATYDRGVALDAMGKTPEAIVDYSAAIRLDPTFAPAINNRANAYRRMGRTAAAKRDYIAALKCRGALREYPYFGLGQIAEKQGDVAAARDYYLKALAANPAFAVAAMGLVALDKRSHEAIASATPTQPDVIVPASAQPDAIVPGRSKPDVKAPERIHEVIAPVHAKPEVKVPGRAAPVRVAEVDPVLRHAIVEKQNGKAIQIQLGAFREQEIANQGWNKIVAASGDVLKDLSPITVSVDLPGKGRFWRLRTNVTDRQEARRLCAALIGQGQACIIARD